MNKIRGVMDFCDLVANSGLFAKLTYRNQCVYRIKTNNEPVLYLTFDDGPTPGVTDWVLKTLESYNAKASFFALGKNVEKYRSLFSEVIAAGHVVGNHTYNHLKGINVSIKRYLEDIEQANRLINSKLFRPPYGRVWPKQIKAVERLGYKVILWTVISCDYNQQLEPKRVYKLVMRWLKPGAIIVFHDSLKAKNNLRYALPKLLDSLADKYRFEPLPVSQLLAE